MDLVCRVRSSLIGSKGADSRSEDVVVRALTAADDSDINGEEQKSRVRGFFYKRYERD